MIVAALLLATAVDLHAELARAVETYHVPAISATVTRADGVVAHGVSGVRVAGRPDLVRIDDAFHIGSCTKPFVATLAAMLVERKKLAWSTTILDVFPEWKATIRPDYAKVTLAQLLSHEAGMGAFGDTEDFANVPRLEGDAVARRRAFAKYVVTASAPVAPPGTASPGTSSRGG